MCAVPVVLVAAACAHAQVVPARRAPDFVRDDGVKPTEPRAQFADGFDIVRDEVIEDRLDWGQDRAKLVRFVARKR